MGFAFERRQPIFSKGVVGKPIHSVDSGVLGRPSVMHDARQGIRQHRDGSMKSDRIKNWPKEERLRVRFIATRVPR